MFKPNCVAALKRASTWIRNNVAPLALIPAFLIFVIGSMWLIPWTQECIKRLLGKEAEGLVFLSIAFLTVIHLVFKPVVHGNEKLFNLVKILLDVQVAVGFSLFFTNLIDPSLHASPQKYVYMFVVGVVMFAVELIAETGHTIALVADIEKRFEGIENGFRDSLTKQESDRDDFAKQLTSTSRLVAAAQTILEDVNFAGVAAKAFELRDLRDPQKNNYPNLPEALGAALETISVWFHSGRQIGKTDDVNDTARKAWWKAMRIYHHEEKYDVTRYEVATNVRNYAFMILGIISEYLDAVKSKDKDGKSKVIVLQATAFSPKDFYNYPDGTEGGRYYHDPEFFGTYRRALSMVLKHDRIVPLRILLAAMGNEEGERKDTRDLGWTLDHVKKICIDCVRLKAVPVAVPIGSDSVVNSLKQIRNEKDLAERHDPAVRSPRLGKGYFWVPVFAEFENLATKLDKFTLNWGVRAAWHLGNQKYAPTKNPELHHLDFQQDLREPTFNPMKRVKDVWREKLWPSIKFSIEAQETAAWDSLKRTLHKVVTGREAAAQDITPDDTFLRGIEQFVNDNVNDDDTRRIMLALAKTIFRETCECRKRLLDALVGTSKSVKQDTIALESLMLIEMVQRVDSSMTLLGMMVRKPLELPQSAMGGALGHAEKWLYHVLNLVEFRLMPDSIASSGPVSIWELFRRDILAIDDGDRQSIYDQLLSRFRVVTVVEYSQATGKQQSSSEPVSPRLMTTVREMDELGIYSEFLLIGETGDDTGTASLDARELFEELKSPLLIGVEMSEPLRTCRIVLHSKKDENEPLTKHISWLKKTLTPDNKEVTVSFLKDIVSEEAMLTKGGTP